MTEDDEGPLRNAEGDALLYDWFKHLTTLALLTLGGVLSLSQVADAEDIKKPVLVGVLIAIAAAGVLSFSGAEQVVRARVANAKIPKQALVLQKAAPAILSLGVGAFLYLFVRSMN